MPRNGDDHVGSGAKGWCVEVEGSRRVRSAHQTEADAVKAGREGVKRNQSELLVHGRDAKFGSATPTGTTLAARRGNCPAGSEWEMTNEEEEGWDSSQSISSWATRRSRR
jgi:hypothetical protein